MPTAADGRGLAPPGGSVSAPAGRPSLRRSSGEQQRQRRAAAPRTDRPCRTMERRKKVVGRGCRRFAGQKHVENAAGSAGQCGRKVVPARADAEAETATKHSNSTSRLPTTPYDWRLSSARKRTWQIGRVMTGMSSPNLADRRFTFDQFSSLHYSRSSTPTIVELHVSVGGTNSGSVRHSAVFVLAGSVDQLPSICSEYGAAFHERSRVRRA